MRGETSLGFNVTSLLSTFIFKVNGTGPLAGHYQLFDSEEPRCKWAKISWKGEILFRRDGCAYISSSGDAFCFETLGNDEYETRWCFFYAKNISYFWCINVFVQLFGWLKDLRNSFPSCGVLDENACFFSKCFERLDLRKLRPLWEPPTADHLHKLGWHEQSIHALLGFGSSP